MLVRLFKNDVPLLGSDSLCYVDGRKSIEGQREQIRQRNERYVNFPHLICDGYAKYLKRSENYKIIKL